MNDSPIHRNPGAENYERHKELATINKIAQLLGQNKALQDTMQQIVGLLPAGWQYPADAAVRIEIDGKTYQSPHFYDSKWGLEQLIRSKSGIAGRIQLRYTREFPDIEIGPFLHEEKDILLQVSIMIGDYLDRKQAQPKPERIDDHTSTPVFSRQLLQRFLNKSNSDRDIYHDLMPFKVKEILLISSLYDAFIIEKEGRFSEHVLGEYQQLNLTSVPRITGVSNEQEALSLMTKRHFDLIIIMVGVDKQAPMLISQKIKAHYPYVPVFLLLNNNSDVAYYQDFLNSTNSFDKIFIWNGDSKIFFSMIKLVEDKINCKNDTEVGRVRVLLLVEDSPQFYSRILPMLYKTVMEQTRRIIDDVSTDELYKVLRMRARPKIILASTYEEAREVIEVYKEFMLCLITDVKYHKAGNFDENAGVELVRYTKKLIHDLPTIIQSSDPKNVYLADQSNSMFIDKNSETLSHDFQNFITRYLGFGNFVFRDNSGQKIEEARTLKEFETKLRDIPDESLVFHASRDHFSMWLMARGEIRVAKIINPKKVTDFETTQQLRQVILDMINKFRNEQDFGKIVPFEESAWERGTNILRLSEGSLGGKGRGMAFIYTLIHNYEFGQQVPDINIRAPKTAVIGIDEFELFMERNHLYDTDLLNGSQENLKKTFLEGRLSTTLTKRLRSLLKHIIKPIAVRSSGLFEDSLTQPFAGIFETYLLPNNHPDPEVRLQQTLDAVKLVYASVYSETAKGYVKAISHHLEEEKMGVVIQEVVGNPYGEVYYPHISGVAQSFNFYPVSHMKPEEGFAVAAIGLGKYVVEGNKAYRFSPKYPKTEINSPKDQFQNSQLNFFAVDLSQKELKLLERGDEAGLKLLDIREAEKHGTLKHCASVYNPENNHIYPGLSKAGPRIVNFANILKYNYIPLAQALEVVLDVVKEAMGSPVEIEWAIDLEKDENNRATLYLLQIKPLIGSRQDFNIDLSEIRKKDSLLFSEKAMGNGVIRHIDDVIYVDVDKFDKSKTVEMAAEIEQLNEKMIQDQRQYVLIGPGRWGTRDRWIGIPVNWPQISHAKVIVETSLEEFPLDASSGSHFFYNVTAMNVGYFNVQPERGKSFINYELLSRQQLIEAGTYFRHVRFEKPLCIKMDGKKRVSLISVENPAAMDY